MKRFTLGGAAISAAVCIMLHPSAGLFAEPAAKAPADADCHCDKKAETSSVKKVIPEDGSPALGPQTAPVTVVEFTDYDCPYCKRADQTMAALRAKYGNKVRWVVKQMPLPMHEHARSAALAALAAQEQGKFFEMHAALFAQTDHSAQGLDSDAKKAGLDAAAFHTALGDATLSDALERDHALAKKLGVEGVPTFFVNGKLLQGAQPQASFESLIDAEL